MGEQRHSCRQRWNSKEWSHAEWGWGQGQKESQVENERLPLSLYLLCTFVFILQGLQTHMTQRAHWVSNVGEQFKEGNSGVQEFCSPPPTPFQHSSHLPPPSNLEKAGQGYARWDGGRKLNTLQRFISNLQLEVGWGLKSENQRAELGRLREYPQYRSLELKQN